MMDDGQTIDVGHVHVQVMLDGERRCVKHCPHPQHVAERVQGCRINEISSDFGTYRNVVFDGAEYEHAADLLDAVRDGSYPQSDDAECGYCDGLGHEHQKPCPECGGNDPYPSGGDAK